MSDVVNIEITRYKSGISEKVEDKVITERPLNVFVNNEYYITLMCTPSELEELSIGFLFSQGFITSKNEIEDIQFSTGDIVFVKLSKKIELHEKHRKAIVSGCGRGIVDLNMINENELYKVKSRCTFSAENILKCMKEFNAMSDLFLQTGGVHSCSLCGSDGIEMFSEDIGRHNAIDKILGKCILNNINRGEKMLFTTGRISSDSIVKTVKAGIPVLVSHSGPTDLAVDMAKSLNLTLIGFARGNRMNIYYGNERVLEL